MGSNLIARSILFPLVPLVLRVFFGGEGWGGVVKWGFLGGFWGFWWCLLVSDDTVGDG